MVGIFVTSFTLIQALIVIFFGIPTTLSLTTSGQLKKNNGIVKKYIISLFVLLFLFGLATLIILSLSPEFSWGYIFGGGMALLFGLGRIGTNEANMNDFVESNKQHFDKDAPDIFEKILGDYENTHSTKEISQKMNEFNSEIDTTETSLDMNNPFDRDEVTMSAISATCKHVRDIDSEINRDMNEETRAQLKQVVKDSRIDPHHAQATADASVEALNRATRKE